MSRILSSLIKTLVLVFLFAGATACVGGSSTGGVETAVSAVDGGENPVFKEQAADPCADSDQQADLLCQWFPKKIHGRFEKEEGNFVDAIQTNYYDRDGKPVKITFTAADNPSNVFRTIEIIDDPEQLQFPQLSGNERHRKETLDVDGNGVPDKITWDFTNYGEDGREVWALQKVVYQDNYAGLPSEETTREYRYDPNTPESVLVNINQSNLKGTQYYLAAMGTEKVFKDSQDRVTRREVLIGRTDDMVNATYEYILTTTTMDYAPTGNLASIRESEVNCGTDGKCSYAETSNPFQNTEKVFDVDADGKTVGYTQLINHDSDPEWDVVEKCVDGSAATEDLKKMECSIENPGTSQASEVYEVSTEFERLYQSLGLEGPAA